MSFSANFILELVLRVSYQLPLWMILASLDFFLKGSLPDPPAFRTYTIEFISKAGRVISMVLVTYVTVYTPFDDQFEKVIAK